MKVSSTQHQQAPPKVETPKQAPVQAQQKAQEAPQAQAPAHLGKNIDTKG